MCLANENRVALVAEKVSISGRLEGALVMVRTLVSPTMTCVEVVLGNV